MATYEEIYGKRVEVLSSDPTLNSSYEGQVWYNSATGTLKSVVAFDSWFSGSPLSETRRLAGGFGTTSAAITFGGFPGNKTSTEEYNGSGWSGGGALNNGNARFAGSVGTLTAGLRAGGLGSPTVYVDNVEEYNGSSWTSVNALPAARGAGSIGGIGTQTAAIIAVGGTGIPTTADAASLKYDGTNWTAGGSMNTARTYTAGFGTQTAGLYAGGYVTAAVANVETYDGTSWSETTDTSTGRYSLVSSNNSPQTSGIVAGGDAIPGRTAATESWDGSSWTTRSNMGSARSTATGAGTSSSSLISVGGITPSTSPGPAGSSTMEEFSSSINTITAAAWASGGALGTPRGYNAGSGTQTAAVCFNGYNPGGLQNAVENYNGSAWSEQGTQNTARNQAAGVGLQTASLVFGGQGIPSPAQYAVCETYDGSSFTEVGNLNTARRALGGAGTQTAALGFLGNASGPADTTSSESWNGSAWTATPSANTARTLVLGAFGTSTAAVAVGGNKPPGGAQSNDVEEWNGSSWTSVTNLPYGGNAQGGSGTLTAGLVFGGNDGSALTTTLGYDGTNWSSRPSLSTARQGGAPARNGTSELTLLAGGSPYTTATEEFTGATETVTASTLTTS
jgi:hypothetical protein